MSDDIVQDMAQTLADVLPGHDPNTGPICGPLFGPRPRTMTIEEVRALEGRSPTHAEVVSARIVAFPRAVQAIRNCDRAPLPEKDILRLAVELVR